MFPLWLQAGFWGLVGGCALIIGAMLGYFVKIPQWAIAVVMPFGAGVLISALAFELMDEAYTTGGFDSSVSGFLGGAVVYTAANWYLAHQGAKHRSNIPEGLSSAAGMKQVGTKATYIFGIWAGIALLSGLASLLGYTVFSHLSKEIIAATTAVAAGGILAMISDTMIPEAFEQAHDFAGLITVLGFLCSFVLSKLGG